MSPKKAKEFTNVLREIANWSYAISKVVRELIIENKPQKDLKNFLEKSILKGEFEPFNETLGRIISAEENPKGKHVIVVPSSIAEEYFIDLFSLYTNGKDINDYLERIGERTYRTLKGNTIKFNDYPRK